MNNEATFYIVKYCVRVMFERWGAPDKYAELSQKLVSTIKHEMINGKFSDHIHINDDGFGDEVDIRWNAEFDPNTITSEEDDIILGEIIDENPKEMLQVAGVYELVREHFNNDIISRAEENEMHKLMAGRGDYGNKN
jgi:hypothetical protein